jgi:hypothetical protein
MQKHKIGRNKISRDDNMPECEQGWLWVLSGILFFLFFIILIMSGPLIMLSFWKHTCASLVGIFVVSFFIAATTLASILFASHSFKDEKHTRLL